MYLPGTRLVMCEEPMIPDPYEFNHVIVKPSKMKGGGEGLFAKVNVAKGTVISFYNGIQRTSKEIVSW